MGEPSDNLYVTNLPTGLDESMIMQFFSIYGTVTSCKVLRNPIATGKTAALVRFASVEEASAILVSLDGNVPTGLEEPVQIKFASKPGAPKGCGKVGMGMQAGMSMGMAAAQQQVYPAQQQGGYGKSPWDAGGGTAYAAGPYGSPAGAKGGNVVGGNWGEPEMSDNIYVQGLPPGTTEESLQQTFMEFGTIKSLKLLPTKGPDMPCAALIRYDSAETAKLTKEILNGQTPEGFTNPLVVRYANTPGTQAACGKGAWQAPQQQQQQQQWDNAWVSKGAGKGQQAHPADGSSCASLVDMVYQSDMLPGGRKYFNERASLYIAGLPFDATEAHLYKMFSPYGAIHTCSAKMGGSNEQSWAIGFVNYLDPMSADAAITAYNGMSLPDGGQLKVTIKTKSAGKG